MSKSQNTLNKSADYCCYKISGFLEIFVPDIVCNATLLFNLNIIFPILSYYDTKYLPSVLRGQPKTSIFHRFEFMPLIKYKIYLGFILLGNFSVAFLYLITGHQIELYFCGLYSCRASSPATPPCASLNTHSGFISTFIWDCGGCGAVRWVTGEGM